jgi:hypothetical protein
MSRLRVGVDIDGVLAEFVPSARKLCKQLFNGRPDDRLVQTSWAFDSLGISKDEENVLWNVIDNTPNWWMGLGKTPGASIEKMQELIQTCMVIFITNRKDGNVGKPIEEQSSSWLARTFRLLNPTVLIMNDKGPLLNALKLNHFVDDRPKNIQECNLYAPKCEATLLNETYNQDFIYDKRVNSFDEFVDKVLSKND